MTTWRPIPGFEGRYDVDGLDVGQEMLRLGLAKAYDGGKR